jgi:methionine-rich copper-binding protein CopC
MRTRIRLVLALALSPALAFSHGKVVGSDPAEGAVLARAPSSVTLHFNEAVHVTSASLAVAAGAAVKLALPAGKPSKDVTLVLPALAPGRAELRWRAIGDDGHVVPGALHFFIRPAPH